MKKLGLCSVTLLQLLMLELLPRDQWSSGKKKDQLEDYAHLVNKNFDDTGQLQQYVILSRKTVLFCDCQALSSFSVD